MNKKLTNKINDMRSLMLIKENVDEYYMDTPKPKQWDTTTTDDSDNAAYYEEPEEKPDDNSYWKQTATEPTNNSYNQPKSGEHKYQIPQEPAKKINTAFGNAFTKMTQPGDVNQIMRLMEYHQLGLLFEGYRANFKEDNLQEAHDVFSSLIIKHVGNAINEIKKRQPAPPTTQSKAIGNSANSHFFKNLLTILPTDSITASISQDFEAQYNKKLNKIEVQRFLKELLVGLSGLSNTQMMDLIKRGGVKPKEYSKIITSLYDSEESGETPEQQMSSEPQADVQEPQNSEPYYSDNHLEKGNDYYDDNHLDGREPDMPNAQQFMPDRVGDFNLRSLRHEARTALTQKAIEVLKRNSMPVDQVHMIEAIRQLVDDINKSGKKRVPSITGFS